MIFTSLSKSVPSDFLTKGVDGNKPSGPVAILAASCCISSSICFPYRELLSQIASPYSRKGMINAVLLFQEMSFLILIFPSFIILVHAFSAIHV